MSEVKSVIGVKVKYLDFLGFQRFGKVVRCEPSINLPEDVVYLYIEDDDPDYNTHNMTTETGMIYYADIRLSTEVELDED